MIPGQKTKSHGMTTTADCPAGVRGRSQGVQGPWGGGVPNFPDGHKETIPTTKELVRGRGAGTRLSHENQNKIPRGGGGGGHEAAKGSQTGRSCDPKIENRIPAIKNIQ